MKRKRKKKHRPTCYRFETNSSAIEFEVHRWKNGFSRLRNFLFNSICLVHSSHNMNLNNTIPYFQRDNISVMVRSKPFFVFIILAHKSNSLLYFFLFVSSGEYSIFEKLHFCATSTHFFFLF